MKYYRIRRLTIFPLSKLLGAAWRDAGESKDRKAFASVLEMVRQVSESKEINAAGMLSAVLTTDIRQITSSLHFSFLVR